MNLLRRYWALLAAAAVVILAVVLMQIHALPQTDKAAGTQSDPSVGTSQYLAPKDASKIPSNGNHTPASPPVAVIENPDAVPALSDVNNKCPWADPRGNNPPSLQDDNVGAQKLSDMPDTASTNTLKCAVARAKAAGYTVAGDSVKCTESIVEVHDPSANTLWTFRPFCMQVGRTGNPTCSVQLIPTDYQGNFVWYEEPDLRHQNKSEEYVAMQNGFDNC